MSLLYMDGFDGQDYALRYTSQYVVGLGATAPVWSSGSSSTARFGTGSTLALKPNGSGSASWNSSMAQIRVIPTSNKVFVGTATKIINTSGATAAIGLMSNGGTVGQCYVLFDGYSRTVTAYRGPLVSGSLGTSIGSATNALPSNSWFYAEVSATISSTVGTMTVRVNGAPVLSLSSINTQANTSYTTIDGVAIGSYTNTNSVITTYFDDFYICNDQGTANNTFLGDVQIQTLLPNGAGSSTQLAPTGSASNYANANDVPDNTSTYNASTTVGSRDTYAMSDLAGGIGKVFGVQQITHAFKTTSGLGNMKSAQLSGSTLSYGATNALGTSNAAFVDLNENNPATGAPYTVGDLNNLEAGAETA